MADRHKKPVLTLIVLLTYFPPLIGTGGMLGRSVLAFHGFLEWIPINVRRKRNLIPMKSLYKSHKACCHIFRNMIRRVSLCGLLVIASVTGCASVNYKAAELPTRFQAMRLTNSQTVDLTRFSTSTANSERISNGDVLEVSISAGLGKDDSITFPVRVADNGNASLPHIGSLSLTGLELEEAEAAVTTACIQKQLYRQPHVTVTMKRPKTNRVTVIGAVKEPGIYELRGSSSDILSAIVSAGGLDEDAGTIVEVRNPKGSAAGSQNRPDMIAGGNSSPNGIDLVNHEVPIVTSGATSVKIDLASATAVTKKDVAVMDGGVVRVERRDPKPVHIGGLVKKPGRYEYPLAEDLRLLEAIDLAGGESNPVADKVYIIRPVKGANQPILIQASISKAKSDPDENLRLGPGDKVSVEKTFSTVLIDTIRVIGFTVGGSVF